MSVVFFIAVYSICNYYYPEDGTVESDRNWWHLKTDLYMLLVCIWVGIASMDKQTDKTIKIIQKIITSIGIGYGIANFIDRRFLHDRDFGMNDLSIVLVVVFISTIDLPKIIKKGIKYYEQNLTK
jgi:hypothetical protein